MPTTPQERLKKYGLDTFNPVMQIANVPFALDVSSDEAEQSTRAQIESLRKAMAADGRNQDMSALLSRVNELSAKRRLRDTISSGSEPDDDMFRAAYVLPDRYESVLSQGKQLQEKGLETFLRENPTIGNEQAKQIMRESESIKGQLLKDYADGQRFNNYNPRFGDEFVSPEKIAGLQGLGQSAQSVLESAGFGEDVSNALSPMSSGINPDRYNEAQPTGGITGKEGSEAAVRKAMEQTGRTPEAPDTYQSPVRQQALGGVRGSMTYSPEGGKPVQTGAMQNEPMVEQSASQQGTARRLAERQAAQQPAQPEQMDAGTIPQAQTTAAPVAPAPQATTTPQAPTGTQAPTGQQRSDSGAFAAAVGMAIGDTNPALARALTAAYDGAIAAQSEVRDSSIGFAAQSDLDTRAFIDKLDAKFLASSGQMQDVLDNSLQSNQTFLAQKEDAAKADLDFREAMAVAQMEEQKNEQLETMHNRLALNGGWGSSNGLKEIDTANYKWTTAISNLRKEFGFKHADLAISFKGDYMKLQDQYRVDSMVNLRDYQDKLTNLSMQGFSSIQARKAAENEAQNTYRTNVEKLRIDKAKAIEDQATAAEQKIEDRRTAAAEGRKAAFDELKWYVQTYGSNTPQAAIDSLAQRLPGVDVDSIVATQSISEMEKAKKSSGVGGGSSYGFSFGQTDSLGNPMSFESYLAEKQGEANMSFGDADIAKARKEYDVMVADREKLSPAKLTSRLKDKAIGLAKWASAEAYSTVNTYLASGQYQLANDYIDGLGDSPGETERKDFTQALVVKQSMAEIDVLIEELGAIGPVVGRFRSVNPYDNRVVRLNQLITQTIPSLARGIYKEVGVLTDTDIATYRSTMANPNLTYEQAKQATIDTIRKVNMSLDAQISVMDAAKMNVREFRKLAEAEPVVNMNAIAPIGSEIQTTENATSVFEYVNSLK